MKYAKSIRVFYKTAIMFTLNIPKNSRSNLDKNRLRQCSFIMEVDMTSKNGYSEESKRDSVRLSEKHGVKAAAKSQGFLCPVCIDGDVLI